MTEQTAPRVRFAPSPTGFLHVGGARTALFNWLFARRHGGVFVLRIEDTDRERSSDAMTQAILDGMRWLGLDWDEGPVHQADGLARHRQDGRRLLENGTAYRCFCTVEELDRRRQAHPDGPDAFRYDRRCAAIPADESASRAAGGEAHTVRFLVPPGRTVWADAVHGEISFDNGDIEDFIILRTDGTPIYNMAVVSDDADMRITHVIRGDDHISNTPKQIMLYRALDVAVPVFAHVPMILGADGRRLSKRHGATAIGEYEAQGILPDAMVNFLALLGWSPGNDDEILDRAELVRRFDLTGINRKSAVFDPTKLEWMNGRYLAARASSELGTAVREILRSGGALPTEAESMPDAWWEQLAELLKVRARTLADMALQARPYVGEDLEYDEAAVAKHWKDTDATVERLEEIGRRFAALEPFEPAALEETLRAYAGELGVGAGKVIHPLRVALTGTGASPGIFDVAMLLGRDRVLDRIRRAVARVRAGAVGK
ncbi:MAG TPA: glutamate--tRNA ligase [Longimicrobiales bacterium]|nr:glutamate--tRNA ligase [Longimicrobiales bacterium]